MVKVERNKKMKEQDMFAVRNKDEVRKYRISASCLSSHRSPVWSSPKYFFPFHHDFSFMHDHETPLSLRRM